MIRLTVNAKSGPQIFVFNQPTIVMGTDASRVDVVLIGPTIQPIHLKITEQKEALILINFANDPFASVNGHAFGKKVLHSGDVIFVDQMTILFEKLSPALKEPSSFLSSLVDRSQESLAPPSEHAVTDSSSHFALPFEGEVEALEEEEWPPTLLEKDFNDQELKETRKGGARSADLFIGLFFRGASLS